MGAGGRPILRAAGVKIEAAGGIEWVCNQIRDGRFLTDIARGLGITRSLLWMWVCMGKHPERKQLYQRARLEAAGAIAERAVEIADQADENSPAGVQKARLQVDTRKWITERYDPETFGKPSPSNMIMIGELHLSALQALGSPTALPAAVPAVLEGEAVEVEALPEPALEDLL